MPGVLDDGVSKLGLREKAESVKLWLPSHLDTAERNSLCLGSVIASEKELRFGQLHDTLDELRRARRIRRGLITFHKVQLTGEGQKTQTRSRAVVSTIQERINRAVQRYRAARNALLQLDPSGSWQDLYPVLDDRDNRGPGKEPEEVSASNGLYAPSWIWLSNPNATAGDPAKSTISPDEVNEDMRVEWAQCVARADRWEEEVILLQEEMRRVVHFLRWKSKDWVSKAEARAGVVAPVVLSGLSAYARKQASVFHDLAIRFCQRWRSNLISLSLSLSHTWATEFLKTQGAPLDNLDFKKRGPKRQECDPTESSATPPRVEPIPTNTTVPPPISTNPETRNNDDNPSVDVGSDDGGSGVGSDSNDSDGYSGGDDSDGYSGGDDSDENSSEFDESEHEYW